jgi:hypothetical protein
MSQLLIKIVAIGTKFFVLESILYGGNHSPNSLNIMYSTHMKSNMAQSLFDALPSPLLNPLEGPTM